MVSGHMPKVNINPTINKATRRYLMRSDSVMCSPFFGDSAHLVHFSNALRDHSMKAESRKNVFTRNCDLMRGKTHHFFKSPACCCDSICQRHHKRGSQVVTDLICPGSPVPYLPLKNAHDCIVKRE